MRVSLHSLCFLLGRSLPKQWAASLTSLDRSYFPGVPRNLEEPDLTHSNPVVLDNKVMSEGGRNRDSACGMRWAFNCSAARPGAPGSLSSNSCSRFVQQPTRLC